MCKGLQVKAEVITFPPVRSTPPLRSPTALEASFWDKGRPRRLWLMCSNKDVPNLSTPLQGKGNINGLGSISAHSVGSKSLHYGGVRMLTDCILSYLSQHCQHTITTLQASHVSSAPSLHICYTLLLFSLVLTTAALCISLLSWRLWQNF